MKRTGVRPAGTQNHLNRDFGAGVPNNTGRISVWCWICIPGWWGLVDEFAGKSTRHPGGIDGGVALGRTPVILHSDRGGQFTSQEYQRFLEAHQDPQHECGGSCAENAARELLRRTQTRTGEPTPLPEESRGESGYL